MVKRDIQNIQNNELINLKEASQLYDYTQHHFGLLCRQGKLKAERVGKKWFTTREWIEKYLSEVEEKYKKTICHYTQQEKIAVKRKLPPISLERLPPIKLPPVKFIPRITPFTPAVLRGTRLIMGSSFALLFVVFLYFGVLNLASFDYREFSSNVEQFIKEPPASAVVFLEDTQKNFSDFSQDIEGFNTSSLFSGSRSFGDVLRQFVVTTRDNVFAFGADMKRWGSEFKTWAWNYGDSIKLAFVKTPEAETSPPKVGESEANEGMVVLPQSFSELSDSELKRNIQDVFSDNVVVQPDEEGDAGIIQPIFKKGKGEEYLYVMVPVEEEEQEKHE